MVQLCREAPPRAVAPHSPSKEVAMPQHQSPSSDTPIVTPVRIADDRPSGRLEVVEESERGKRTLAWGFDSREAAERWIEGHNRVSGWHKLTLDDA